MYDDVQKIIIITALVITVPIILYFSLNQSIYDMADDIAVKNGDDCRLLDEEDLKILSKKQYADARKYFEEFPNAKITLKGIIEDRPPPYCIYSFGGVSGDIQGNMNLTFERPTAELTRILTYCFDLPDGYSESNMFTDWNETMAEIQTYGCW